MAFAVQCRTPTAVYHIIEDAGLSAVLQFEIYNSPDLSQRLDYCEGFLFSYPLTAGFGISKSYARGFGSASNISASTSPNSLRDADGLTSMVVEVYGSRRMIQYIS